MQVGRHQGEEAELRRLAVLARRAAREVAADDAQARQAAPAGAVEAALDVAAFGVELGVAEAETDRARPFPAVQADAAVALFLGEVEAPLHAGDRVEAALDGLGLGLDLLHAHTIRADAFGPGLEPFRRRRADAVQVERNEAEHALSCMTSPASDTTIAREFVQFAL